MSKKSKKRIFNTLCLCALVVFLSCSGKHLDKDLARRTISNQFAIDEEQVEVKEVSALAGTVLVEAELKLTFVMQMGKDNQWHVVKVRHSGDAWESPETFLQSVPQSSLNRSLESAFLAEIQAP